VVKRDKYELAGALADILPLRARSNGREAVRAISLENVAKCIASIYDEVSRDKRIVGPLIATRTQE
jgi:hypothetical protein